MAEVVEFEWYPEPLVVAGQIDDIANALENLNIPLTLSLPEVSAAIQRQFDSEGEGSWPYWSEKYAPFAEANNEGILIQSGALVEGATSEEALAVVDDSIIWTGAGVPEMWEWHQEGLPDRATKGGSPNPLPARPFISLDSVAEAAITAIFLAWLDAVASGAENLKGLSGIQPVGAVISNVGASGFRFRGAGGRFVSSNG